MVVTTVGAAAASAVSTAIAVATAFLRALPIVVPVGPHVPDGARIVVYVELLLAEGEPAMHHGF